MRIIIDAMGGDNAPAEIVKGAVMAKQRLGVEVTLVGRAEDVRACLENEGCTEIDIVDAREVISMADDPSTATRRKKDSSMAVALNLLREGKGDAVVSAGSTGALLTGATLTVKRIRGIRRAALAPVLPAGEHGVMLIDCGANVECTAEYLLQFAYMGSFYAKKIMGCDSPRVGLLNVGTEDTKGGALQHQAFALLKKAGEEGRINFIGNVEGTDVYAGKADVVVTDGFTGNIYLKTVEGMGKFMKASLKKIFFRNIGTKIGAMFTMKGIKEISKQMDYRETGGSPLLGTAKPVLKAHGSSDALAFKNAVRQAKDFVERNVIAEMEKVLSENTEG